MSSPRTVRSLTKLLDVAGTALWVIDADGRIAFVSGAAAEQLGCTADELVGRRTVAGARESNERIDRLVAALSAPPGTSDVGLLVAPLMLPESHHDDRGGQTRVAAFLRPGNEGPTFAFLAEDDVAFPDNGIVETSIFDAVTIRQHVQAWRQRSDLWHIIGLAGNSRQVRRTRRQIEVASQLRVDTMIVAPRGSAGLSIAQHVQNSTGRESTPEEPSELIDGSLMDEELLGAIASPLIAHLTESNHSVATAVINNLDETPVDAQLRLTQWKAVFGKRLRVIALGQEPLPMLDQEISGQQQHDVEESSTRQPIHEDLQECLSAMTIHVAPLSQRVDDIPIVAAAILDQYRAAGEGTADRFSRNALDALVRYPWPGDLEELQTSIRHAVGVCPTSSIAQQHLPLVVRSYRPRALGDAAKQNIDLDEALKQFEKRVIQETLQETDGNRAEAARRLGISRARLIRRIDGDGP